MPVINSASFYLTVAVSAIGALSGAYYAYLRYKDRKKNQLPEEWVEIGRVSRLYAYPLKSGSPTALDQAECFPIGLKKGLLRDRILLIIDTEDHHYINIINYPEILKIKTSFESGKMVILQHPKMEPIKINLEEVVRMGKVLPTNVWTSPVTYDCGEESSRWISKCLNSDGSTLRLAYYIKGNSQSESGQKIFKKLKNNDTGALAAAVSYHVVTEASIDELNSRLIDPVTDVHFRPNIVLSGSKPFDEDNWKYVKIGENIFEVIYPCFRCYVVTIDPLTGNRKKNNEPLATLRTYRLAKDPKVRKVTGDGPLMGIYMALRSGPGGTISLNEPYYVAY